MVIHKLADVLTFEGDNSSGHGLSSKSRTVALNSVGIDTTQYVGAFGWFVNADSVGTSLDAEIQESDDNITFTNLTVRVKITQLTAAGDAPVLETHVRGITKRYASVLFTPVGTVVGSAIFVGQKKTR